MSISGPYLWLSSLSPPTSSHLSTITSHFSSAGAAEHIQPTPNPDPARVFWPLEKGGYSPKELPVEMQRTASNAENALTNHTQCGNRRETLRAAEDPSLESRRDTPLSRIKLPKLDCSEPLLSISRNATHLTPPGDSAQDSHAEPRDGTQEAEKDPCEMTTPSDEGMGSPAGAEQPKSAADKKRMKRFR